MPLVQLRSSAHTIPRRRVAARTATKHQCQVKESLSLHPVAALAGDSSKRRGGVAGSRGRQCRARPLFPCDSSYRSIELKGRLTGSPPLEEPALLRFVISRAAFEIPIY